MSIATFDYQRALYTDVLIYTAIVFCSAQNEAVGVENHQLVSVS